jgi:hypothetical protein
MTIKQQFKNSLRRGTGEAFLLIKENPHMDFSKEITNASLFNLAYDTQCESRENYLAELIELSGQREKILPIIYQATKTEKDDNWSIGQLFGVAAIFAKRGDSDARKCMYKCFYRNAMEGNEYFGRGEIIE